MAQAKGDKAPEPLASGLAALSGESFHYSRLMAVGLFSLLSEAQGGESDDPEALSATAHALGEHIGLSRPALKKISVSIAATWTRWPKPSS